MRLKSGLMALVVLLSGLVAGTGVTSTAAATGAPFCGITWGSLAKSGGGFSSAPLIAIRTGQHSCYDRVVFEFDGPANGFTVEYGETYTDGEGLALSPYTAGDELLNVRLQAPAYDDDHSSTISYRLGDHVANLAIHPAHQTLRDVLYGGSFEGYTTFAVGVRARLPFRVTVLAGPGTHSRIVLDIAHQWQE